ncbi:MAG TPA: hypothetical protein VFO67_12280 [Gemmatimonadales bacterium]|nr:hypothetical protein [Gemmatimonadales bacterium]
MNRKLRTILLLLAGAWLAPAGCTSLDEIVDVEDPDIVNPGDLQSIAGAVAAFTGGVGDFAFAIVGDNGGTEGQILVGGLMTDEYMHSGTFPTRLEYERRSINQNSNGTLTGVARNLYRARTSLEQSIGLLQTYAPTPASRIGEAFALAGYTYVFFAETYCSGIPFSSSTELGSPKTTDEVLQLAIERFDSALVYAPTGAIANFARVGKARALMNRGKSSFAAAATVAGPVPLTFVYNTTHSVTTGRQQNGVHVFNHLSRRWSVADNEGGNGLNFRTAGDRRVRVTADPVGGFDGTTPQFNLTKYPARTTPVPIGTGLEAKLIVAEALLDAGNTVAWLDTLNFLRANARTLGFLGPADTTAADTLAPLPDPTSAVLRESLMFRERAFWLFATGHRLGDLRRLMRQYGRLEDGVFPTGTHFKGDLYGNDVNVPIPPEELGNPNYTGGCSTTTP